MTYLQPPPFKMSHMDQNVRMSLLPPMPPSMSKRAQKYITSPFSSPCTDSSNTFSAFGDNETWQRNDAQFVIQRTQKFSLLKVRKDLTVQIPRAKSILETNLLTSGLMDTRNLSHHKFHHQYYIPQHKWIPSYRQFAMIGTQSKVCCECYLPFLQ